MRSRRDPGRGRGCCGAAIAALAAVALLGCGEPSQRAERPVVEVFGNVVGEPGERLGAALRTASRNSPVELRYVGVTSFNEQLSNRLERGDRPGIALLPQPGRLADLSRRGLLQPLGDAMAAQLRDSYPSALVDLVSIDGEPAAVWLTVDVKGLVWYRPSTFEDLGLQIPRTLAELTALADRERTDGDRRAPFCVALEAQASTGWVGTDWVESLVIRRLGPSAYDEWAAGGIAFDSPEIESVFVELDSLLRSPGAVFGGGGAALFDPWTSVAAQLLTNDPSCLMVHQADFLRREFPPGTRIGPDGDVDFFVLPGVEPDTAPVLLGGLLAAPLDSSPEVAAALDMLAGADVATQLSRTGLFLSPHADVAWAELDQPVAARLAAIIDEASVVRFDASDLMVPEVGAGTFWAGMRSFFGGERLDAVVQQIDAGRARSPE